MKALARILPQSILLILLMSAFSVGQTGPGITGISPSVGPVSPVGGPITIKGSGFGTVQGGSTVTLRSMVTAPSSWSDTKIVIPVPAAVPSGFADVAVMVNGTASNSKSFLVIPVITKISPLSGVVGTPATVTGTSFGAQQGSSTITFNGIAVAPTTWSDTSITATVPNTSGLASIVVTVNGFTTNSPSFIVTPSISASQPSAAPIGSQVTISGSGFGSSPGTVGSVTFNGTVATVTNWSTNSITATVPSGASSGNIVVNTASNLTSSGVSFNIIQPLSISAMASPFSNGAGWNNTPVTVSFQCAGGLAPVTCPASQTVSTEGANQVITGSASDSAGNTASASVTVNLDRSPPVISIGSPADGSTVSRQILRLTGSLADNLSGVAAVSCNGSAASIFSGLFSCNIPLSVGSNTIQVQAVDVAGNTASSSPLTVTFSPIAPVAIFITPTFANMTVGQSRTVKLVGNLGQPVLGATWKISDSTIVSITADDPPQLTAVAQGTATLTANLGSLTSTMTVNVSTGSLPAGTLLWSVDPTGSDGLGMARANPIQDGDPDIYLIEDLTIRALTADGQQLWATQVSASGSGGAAPIASASSPSPVISQQAQQQSQGNTSSPFVASIVGSWKEVLKASGATNHSDALMAERQKIMQKMKAKASSSPSVSASSPGVIQEAPLAAASRSLTFINQLIADNSGGSVAVLSTCPDSNCQTFTQAFTRIESASQQQTWTLGLNLDPNETIGSVGDVALGLDDTIYASVVYGPLQTDLGLGQLKSAIVAIDNTTGQLKFTLQIPPSRFHFTLNDKTGSVLQDNSEDQAAEIGPIAVMPDGSLRALVSTAHFTQVTTQGGKDSPCGDPAITSCVTALSDHQSLQLLVVQPDGSSSMQPVQSFNFDATNCAPASGANPCNIPPGRPEHYVAQEVIPDGLGGTLAEYSIEKQDISHPFQVVFQSQVRRVDSSGGSQDYDMATFLAPFRPGENLAASGSLLLGANNVVYGTAVATVAFDVTNGAQLWHTPFTGPKSTGLVAATNDGRLVAREQLGPLDFTADALEFFDPSGTLTLSPLNPNLRGVNYFDPGSFMSVSLGGQAQLEVAPTTVPLDEATVWNLPGGNKFAQRNPNVPKLKITKIFSFVDKDGFAEIKSVPLVGIANGQTERVKITSDQSAKTASSFNIQLSLQTDPGSKASATFADGTTQMTIQPTVDTPSVLQIKGITPSSKANDISLVAKIGKRIMATQKFSVVSVSITLTASGSISDDNAAKGPYLTKFTPSPGAGTPNFVGLGAFATDKDFGCHVGVQLTGKVTPSDYKGHVILKRTLIHGILYDGPNGTILLESPNAQFPPDDTSEDPARDDDPQSGNSGGKVYDLDAPGPVNVFPSGTGRSFRVNFSEFAVLDDKNNTIVTSDQVPWFARVSCKTDEKDPRTISLTTDFAGDNQGRVGTTPLSFSLK